MKDTSYVRAWRVFREIIDPCVKAEEEQP